ncbi:RHS repeat domain-containing protein [Acinetobacter lactucae]|uniref:RHS repeat domain-containing protein n=1 Tax=Acinetobacter lactucae TaxID=1785128 RepID=UPI0009E37A4B|nr:RHS repeat-associated core domain-containing protein [Acinetobacter lactucae]
MKQSLTVLKFVIVSIISLLSVLQLSYAAEEITYYHNDISGSPLLATNASGNVLWKESYRPYGDKLTKSVASQNNKIGFHGKPFDDDTGLSYMQARYYDPILGRFTGMDPVDYQEDNLHSFNRYAYANNNPYKYVDPDGNHPLVYMLGVGLGAISLADGEPPQAKAGKTVNIAAQGFKKTAVSEGVSRGIANQAKEIRRKTDTLQPGKFAEKSIPARGAQRNFTKEERGKINAIGKDTGCHTCGSKESKTKSGNFIPDHQPPNGLNSSNGSQKLYPHCKDCSGKQAGQVTQEQRRMFLEFKNR